ncbi:hypothetical protein FPZ12_005885 [Amycolatopsis acidicola]|uniref:DUF3558 domain-containing protein n=1 Tax=Amycolatopsis acidicola TaxID=2596893 RepID=A0A5N0VJQ9_9PSEU|nr:hypothetical protein [Amycolatopsis acidicola]KAA9165594.1 hypothetical protein FPZ12_005885 [Amycolatopsis acidicola]
MRVLWCAVLAGLVVLTSTSCTRATTGDAVAATVSLKPAAPVTVATLHLQPPAGTRYTASTPNGTFDGCIASATTACVVRVVDLRTPPAGYAEPSAKRQFGWYPANDTPLCVTQTLVPGSAATGSTLVKSGLAPIGSKKADYAQWQVTCQDGRQNGSVRMWWLPMSKILVVQYNGTPTVDAQVDQMLAAATFD